MIKDFEYEIVVVVVVVFNKFQDNIEFVHQIDDSLNGNVRLFLGKHNKLFCSIFGSSF